MKWARGFCALENRIFRNNQVIDKHLNKIDKTNIVIRTRMLKLEYAEIEFLRKRIFLNGSLQKPENLVGFQRRDFVGNFMLYKSLLDRP